jgi:hypothetical protein
MGKRPAAVELFLGDMGSIQWEIQPASQREDLLAMATKLEQIAANLLRPKWRLLTGSCKRSRCCESTAEERSAVTPHATFCGSRGRVTASDDPVGRETERLPPATAPFLDSTRGGLLNSRVDKREGD